MLFSRFYVVFPGLLFFHLHWSRLFLLFLLYLSFQKLFNKLYLIIINMLTMLIIIVTITLIFIFKKIIMLLLLLLLLLLFIILLLLLFLLLFELTWVTFPFACTPGCMRGLRWTYGAVESSFLPSSVALWVFVHVVCKLLMPCTTPFTFYYYYYYYHYYLFLYYYNYYY